MRNLRIRRAKGLTQGHTVAHGRARTRLRALTPGQGLFCFILMNFHWASALRRPKYQGHPSRGSSAVLCPSKWLPKAGCYLVLASSLRWITFKNIMLSGTSVTVCDHGQVFQVVFFFFFLVFQVLESPSTSAQILRCNFSPFSAPPSSLSSPSHPPLPNSFDLVTNGGISIVLRFERAPFITQEHTLWLPWDRFFVMETIILRQEENEIPSCDLSNFARPNPVLSPSPLTSFASSCAEKGPIVPEIQVYPAFLTAFLHAFISFGRWRRISETGERDSPSAHHPDPSRRAVRL